MPTTAEILAQINTGLQTGANNIYHATGQQNPFLPTKPAKPQTPSEAPKPTQTTTPPADGTPSDKQPGETEKPKINYWFIGIGVVVVLIIAGVFLYNSTQKRKKS